MLIIRIEFEMLINPKQKTGIKRRGAPFLVLTLIKASTLTYRAGWYKRILNAVPM
jgi:hypothetical protein